LGDEIKKNEMGRTRGKYRGQRGAYTVFLGRPKGRRPLARPMQRWDNIKMDFQEVGWECTDWFALAQDRDRCQVFVNAVMNLGVPANAGNFLASQGHVCFSGRTLLHWG